MRDGHVTGVQTCALPILALLRTVAHTWRTDALNRDARMVLDAGRELHHRLGTMTGHLAKVGRSEERRVGKEGGSRGRGNADTTKGPGRGAARRRVPTATE